MAEVLFVTPPCGELHAGRSFHLVNANTIAKHPTIKHKGE